MNIDLAGTLGGTAADGLIDTVTVQGTNGDDTIQVLGSAGSVSVVGLPASVAIAHADAGDQLVVTGGDGDDVISAATLPAGVMKLTIDSGAGDDTILGSQGADVLIGGDGNDFVDGNRGDDVAFLGAGDDVFQWDPGDGNDTVEGQDGVDTLLFNGANIGENIDISANGERARLFRNVANVTMDLNDVETIDLHTLGGADTITVNDLTGTDVGRVNIDLGAAGGSGDGQVDRVIVNGTAAGDVVTVSASGGVIHVTGLAAAVDISHAEPGDVLTINGLAGADVINASALAAGSLTLSLNGGLGDDVLIGSQGADTVNGGDGNDLALLGAGDDTFIWNPGDDNDTVEGQAGVDTLDFNGANVAENISISANGGRVLFSRDVANVTMDLNDVETINFDALGGADTITIGDLSGTDVSEVNINLAGPGGSGDGQPDTIVINATNGDDVVLVFGDNGGVSVVGLSTQVNITGFDV
ncbi:MAG: beta strand repeat-containing protein, partial [Xanthobacteraceae bacterium]